MTRNKKSPEKDQRNMNRFKNILFYTVLTLLLLSAIFTLVMIVVAPADRDLDEAFTKVKSDYILMFIQCLAAAGVLLLPSLLQHKFRIEIPNLMTIILVLFVFAAVYLGEVRSFYYRFAFWDKLLHTFSGVMLGAASFSVLQILHDTEKIRLRASLIALFAFCFAMAAGAVWEIYEFAWDSTLNLNMQKYATETGELLIGRAALMDTMTDLIVDSIGALAISIIGYFSIRRDNSWLARFRLKVCAPSEKQRKAMQAADNSAAEIQAEPVPQADADKVVPSQETDQDPLEDSQRDS